MSTQHFILPIRADRLMGIRRNLSKVNYGNLDGHRCHAQLQRLLPSAIYPLPKCTISLTVNGRRDTKSAICVARVLQRLQLLFSFSLLLVAFNIDHFVDQPRHLFSKSAQFHLKVFTSSSSITLIFVTSFC